MYISETMIIITFDNFIMLIIEDIWIESIAHTLTHNNFNANANNKTYNTRNNNKKILIISCDFLILIFLSVRLLLFCIPFKFFDNDNWFFIDSSIKKFLLLN